MLSAYAKGGQGIDAIEVREAAVPDPGPGEALVRLKAATLNYRDWLFATGGLTGLTRNRTTCRCPAAPARSLRSAMA